MSSSSKSEILTPESIKFNTNWPYQFTTKQIERKITLSNSHFTAIMAGYFEEMGWRELQDGEQPNHLLHMARFLLDFGMYDDNFSGQWPRLPPPASQEAINHLPEVIINEDGKSCPICIKEFKQGEKAKQMPCKHEFHPTCILTWLARTNSCPFCRHELPTDNEAYEAFKKEKIRAEQRKEDLYILHNSMFS